SAASPIQLYLLRSCSALTALYSLSLHDALPIFKQPNVFSIHGSFDSSQREALETKLSQQAGEDARRRADRLAGAQGVKISTVFAITEAGGWGQLAGDFGFSGAAVSFGAMRGKAEMADSGANLVLPRHITLQKSVNVIYKIKP